MLEAYSPFTLRNILSSRAIFTTISERITYEIFNENVLMQEFNQITYNHNFDIIAASVFIVGAINVLYSPSKEKKEKLENIEYFSNIKDTTSKYFFIFMLIFTKNIESAI